MDSARTVVFLLIGVIAQASCSVIDDDLSDCGSSFELNYELRLVTNMTTELQTELATQKDLPLAAALRDYLSRIFTDFAHDVDLSFYDTQGDSLRLHHDQHVMDANQASYTLYLPVRHYMHCAVANVVDNPLVGIANDERCHTSQLLQNEKQDTIGCHTTGLFTARLPMDVKEGVNQSFSVHLYMANCASSLVVDTTGSGIRDLRVYATGFATSFNIADSIYHYGPSPIVRNDEIHTSDNIYQCFTTVNFPTKKRQPSPQQQDATRIIIDKDDPSTSNGIPQWQFIAYATSNDGTLTETRLDISIPLNAGQYKLFWARLLPNGIVQPRSQEMGASVTLNWKPGGTYEPVF